VSGPRDPRVRVVLLGLVPAALLPAVVVWDVTLGTALLLAALVVVGLLARLEWALVLFVAVSPLEDFLATEVNPQATKALGGLVFAALAVRLLARRTPMPSHAAHRCLVVFLLLLLAASVRSANGAPGLEVLLRYLSFAGVYLAAFVVFQDLRWLVRVFAAYVFGSGVAAYLGLQTFLTGEAARAEGPLNDPNDLAFVLVVAIPLALALHARSSRPGWSVIAVLCGLGAAATVSRGGALALLAMAVWAMATRVLTKRIALAGAVVLGSGLAVGAWYAADLVSRALQQKSYVAASNVDTRLLRWRAAVEMMGDSPLLGTGPAGFRLNYDTYAAAYDPTAEFGRTVVHQMFFEVGAELGLPALLAFTAFVAVALLSADTARRLARDRTTWLMAVATEAGLIATVSASLFLTEQYYAPLWLLAAAAVSLQQRVERGDAVGDRRVGTLPLPWEPRGR